MGHLINPISFRLNRNRFWDNLINYAIKKKNIQLFIDKIRKLVQYIFLKYFYVFGYLKPLLDSDEYKIRMYKIVNSLVFLPVNLSKFLKNHTTLNAYAYTRLQFMFKFLLQTLNINIIGFEKSILVIHVGLLDMFFNSLKFYRRARSLIKNKFSFLFNFINFFKKNKSIFNGFKNYYMFLKKKKPFKVKGKNFNKKLYLKKDLIKLLLKKFKFHLKILKNKKIKIKKKKFFFKVQQLKLHAKLKLKKKPIKKNILFRNKKKNLLRLKQKNILFRNKKKNLLRLKQKNILFSNIFFKKKRLILYLKNLKLDLKIKNKFLLRYILLSKQKSYLNQFSKFWYKKNKKFKKKPYKKFQFSKKKRKQIRSNKQTHRNKKIGRLFNNLFEKKQLKKFLKAEFNFNQFKIFNYLIKRRVKLNSIASYRRLKFKLFTNKYLVLKKFRFFKLLFVLVKRIILRKLILFYRLKYIKYCRWLHKFFFISKTKLCKLANQIKIKKLIVNMFVCQGFNFMTAELIAQYIVLKLKIGFTVGLTINHLKRSMEYVENISGYKVCFAGRVNRRQIATYRWFNYNQLSLNSTAAIIDYSFKICQTKWGVVGIKIWVQHKQPNELFFNRVLY